MPGLLKTVLASLAPALPILAQTVHPPPVPHWLSGPETGSNQPGYFRKTFAAELPLLKAVLMTAAEAPSALYLNGAFVGEVASRERAATFDVTPHVRHGQNVVAIRGQSASLRMAALLELNGDLARKTWVATDPTWLTTTNGAVDWTNANAFQAGWFPARSLGRTDTEASNPFHGEVAIDAYNSWKLALKANRATDPATFTLLPGFTAELLRSASPSEGSWVALAFDPQGRLTVAREKRGLLRFALASNEVTGVEVIEDSLAECRGLLYAHGALYVNANNSKGFYRLRDTDGDDRFDETNLLLRTEGGVGHGRNAIVRGPDEALWLVHGNNVTVPAHVSNRSPLKHYAHDALLPCPFDDAMFDGDVLLPAGHVLRTDPEGKRFELFAGGFRNPLDIGFNRDGEMFTFDADMEWDVGSPWYRPNRIHHVVSGADYGWRRGTSKWPDYFPDTLPSTLDIGLASPTGVEFGSASRFPARYREALFIGDWAYGRILAVHLEPAGASYKARSELFVAGRPLNVTDLTFGPDGALYFVTGGRGTQSGLYRVVYSGEETASQDSPENLKARELRQVRRRLERFHGHTEGLVAAEVLEEVWPSLGHDDPWIRHAARVALEHVGVGAWQQRALSEPETVVAATALLALARVGAPELQAALVGRLTFFLAQSPLPEPWPQLTLVRALELALVRMGKPAVALADKVRFALEARYPSSHEPSNHRLCVLLVYLGSPHVLPRTLERLSSATRSEDLMHYLFYLRYVAQGWTIKQRQAWFTAWDKAMAARGARDYFSVLRRIREEVVDRLSASEKESLRGFLSRPAANPMTQPKPLTFVKNWRMEDFDSLAGLRGRSFAAGRAAFHLAQCGVCHRFADEGELTGPDLTQVGARLDRRALLESILEPSKVIDDKYRQTLLVLKDGTTTLGTIEREEPSRIWVRENAAEPPTMIARERILRREASSLSPMPESLLNVLHRDQILDLLAFLESGGNTNHVAFK